MPLESGRYLCVGTPGFAAWVIRTFTRSKYNHAVIIGPDGAIIEATPEGVRLGSLSEYKGMPAIANTAEPMTDAEREAVWAKAQTLIGDGYNFIDLAAIGLGDIGWHWKLLLKIARADRLLICSQLVAVCGDAATPPLPWLCGKADASQVTPADLAKRPGVAPVTLS